MFPIFISNAFGEPDFAKTDVLVSCMSVAYPLRRTGSSPNMSSLEQKDIERPPIYCPQVPTFVQEYFRHQVPCRFAERARRVQEEAGSGPVLADAAGV